MLRQGLLGKSIAVVAVVTFLWAYQPSNAAAQHGGGHGGGSHGGGSHGGGSPGGHGGGHSGGHHNSGFFFGLGYPGYGYGYNGGYYYPGYYGGYAPSYDYGPAYPGGYAPPDYRYSVPPVNAGGFYAPKLPAQPSTTVHVDVRVPGNAEIWFNGAKTSQQGLVRQFESPGLEPGYDYTYEVRARWMENGREVERTRQFVVRAGDRLGVDFLAATQRSAAAQ
jgi:uncharacterized protein (TIGR03000 family)